MNKIFSKLAKMTMLIAGSMMLASFSPSLDGRAVVVDEGVMPSGLFAKTVGYLPGDIISVTNVAQNKNVDLLVIGALDASEGVAIMLTPESAEACGIEKGSNSIVKITKRNGQDDRVYGNAVISSDSQKSYENTSDKASIDNPSADSVAEEVFQEENVPSSVEESVAKVTPSPVVIPEEENEDFEETDFTPEEEVASVTESPAPLIEKAEDNSDAQKRAAERAETIIAATPIVEEEVTQTPFEEETIEEIEEVKENPAAAVAALPYACEEETAADDDDNSESYDAIVLVPTSANPPAPESSSQENESENFVPEKTYAPVPTTVAVRTDLNYQNFMVSGSDDLKRNSYYIQIATMSDDANIQKIVNKYGSNYPITIVPVRNNSKQILIGSLNMDEYAVVLERFKSYGYKDAFLRKIK